MRDSIRHEIFRLLLLKVLVLGLIWWSFFRDEPPLAPLANHIYAVDRAHPAHPEEDE